MSRPLCLADAVCSSALVPMSGLPKSCLARATILKMAVEKWAPEQVARRSIAGVRRELLTVEGSLWSAPSERSDFTWGAAFPSGDPHGCFR